MVKRMIFQNIRIFTAAAVCFDKNEWGIIFLLLDHVGLNLMGVTLSSMMFSFYGRSEHSAEQII